MIVEGFREKIRAKTFSSHYLANCTAIDLFLKKWEKQ